MKDTNFLSFGGVLQPLVELLEKSPRQKNKLIGQEVVIHKKDVKVIIALDFDNNIHLLVTPSAEKDFHLFKLNLKGLKIVNKEWSVSNNPVQNYLDISCATGVLPLFRRPFLRFAEDALFEILNTNGDPVDAVYKTCIRWRKFWSPEIGAEITREWVYGIFGELLFLNDLLKRFGPTVIDSWNGPLGKDHDFQKGTDLAVEVKTSIEIPFTITCNINQLDPHLFKKLYIVCYQLIPSEKGTTLPELVRLAEKMMKKETQLDTFYRLLAVAGYELQHESLYSEFRLSYSEAVVFNVDDNFPKIVEKSFVNPPDHRISGIRYTLQLTGLDEFSVGDITSELKSFA